MRRFKDLERRQLDARRSNRIIAMGGDVTALELEAETERSARGLVAPIFKSPNRLEPDCGH